MDGGNLTVTPASVGAISAPDRRSRQRPELDLDDSTSAAERIFQWFLIATWIFVAVATFAYGLPYYRVPLALRDTSPLDELLRPSGLIGQGYGIIGTLFITVGVGMYSLRKRIPFLKRAGPLHIWLQVHVWLCTLGPFLVLLHTGFKFGGIVAISFWSMTAVALSGIFGRYVYGHIPRAIHGQKTTLESLRAAKAELIQRLNTDYPEEAERLRPYVVSQPPAQPTGLLNALYMALRYDITRRARIARLRRTIATAKLPAWVQKDLVRVVRSQSTLEQQHVMLQPFQRLFHYWHIFHLPLSAVMFVVLAVHIGVAVMLGYTWIF